MPDKDDKNYGKGDKPASERPIHNPRVDVEADPQDGRNPKHREVSERVKKGVTKRVKEALEENKDGGVKRQLDAAEQVVDEESKRVSPGPIKKIKVKIDGEVEGPDGRKTRMPSKRIERDPKG